MFFLKLMEGLEDNLTETILLFGDRFVALKIHFQAPWKDIIPLQNLI